MTELKKCPFCGGDAIVVQLENSFTTYIVKCIDCMARTSSCFKPKLAIEFWNRRVEV